MPGIGDIYRSFEKVAPSSPTRGDVFGSTRRDDVMISEGGPMDYQPIAADGLIGDLQTAALVAPSHICPLINAAVDLDRHLDGRTLLELAAA